MLTKLSKLNAITSEVIITENERKLLSLVPRLGGVSIPIYKELCKTEYQNSIKVSENPCNCITDQFRRHERDPEFNNKRK